MLLPHEREEAGKDVFLGLSISTYFGREMSHVAFEIHTHAQYVWHER